MLAAISGGIHPAIHAERGLEPAVKALARDVFTERAW